MPKSITDIATRHQVLLERFKSGKVRDYQKVAKKFERDLIARATKLNVNSLDELTKKELNSLISYSTSLNKKYQKVIVSDLEKDLGRLAKDDANFERETIGTFVKGSTVNSVANIAYAKALTSPISATGDLLQPFVSNWSKTRVNQVNGVIRKGYKEGQTLSQMTQAIRGTRANNFKDGLTNLQTRQAQAVIRTSVQHVSATARLQTWEANSDIITAYKWRATLDGRTTQQCRSLDGLEFEMGKGPMPPIHINCRSTFVFVTDPKLGLDELDDEGTRSSLKGEVPAKTTYYDWLKTQPVAFQKSAIGVQNTKWLNDGTLKAKEFAKLNLDKNFKPLTLDQMRNKRTMILNGKQGAGQKVLDKKYPRLNPKAKESLFRFMDKKGNLTPERQALHDSIVAEFFKGKKPVKNPTSRMTGGGPAAGKSSIFEGNKVEAIKKNSVKIDSDEIKKFLPEYNLKNQFDDVTAASFAHEESSFISKRIMKEATEKKYNIFFDGTGDSSIESLTKKAKVMRSGGQKLVADYVTVDTAEAVRRNVARFKKTGRMVPNEFVVKTHSNISQILPQTLKDELFDEVTLWDTNTQGKTIKVMSKIKGGETKIYREDLWQDFLNKVVEVD